MTSRVVTVTCGVPHLTVPENTGDPMWDYPLVYVNENNISSPAACYQTVTMLSPGQDVLVFMHDDVTIHDPAWRERILERFKCNDYTVAVGLGGATRLGNRDLYRKSFNIWNMARGGYASNQTDAETHGERFTGDRRVAVLDAFCMAVRRDWLLDRGGWPVGKLTHHCLDLWLACEAARTGREIWMVGASCTHHGGGSSTKPAYSRARWLQGGTLESDHILPHKWIYGEYRDVLPIDVTRWTHGNLLV